MKQRGMIFSTEMVKAILEGHKTQTRRPVRIPSGSFDLMEMRDGVARFIHRTGAVVREKSPFGIPGDVIYVRETWCKALHSDGYMESGSEAVHICYGYKADGVYQCGRKVPDDVKWHPSIHMPKAAARIFLEITDVRVERVRDITEDDAIAEGVNKIFVEETPSPFNDMMGGFHWSYVDYMNRGEYAGYQGDAGAYRKAKDSFKSLWQLIYGPESWERNEWVWVYKFKVLTGTEPQFTDK